MKRAHVLAAGGAAAVAAGLIVLRRRRPRSSPAMGVLPVTTADTRISDYAAALETPLDVFRQQVWAITHPFDHFTDIPGQIEQPPPPPLIDRRFDGLDDLPVKKVHA